MPKNKEPKYEFNVQDIVYDWLSYRKRKIRYQLLILDKDEWKSYTVLVLYSAYPEQNPVGKVLKNVKLNDRYRLVKT